MRTPEAIREDLAAGRFALSEAEAFEEILQSDDVSTAELAELAMSDWLECRRDAFGLQKWSDSELSADVSLNVMSRAVGACLRARGDVMSGDEVAAQVVGPTGERDDLSISVREAAELLVARGWANRCAGGFLFRSSEQ